VAAHSRLRRHRAGLQILVHREFTACRIFLARKRLSRATEMDQVDVVLPRRASASVRCSTLFPFPARQILTLTPYFASKGLISVGWSFSAKVVYIVSVASFFAAATIFSMGRRRCS